MVSHVVTRMASCPTTLERNRGSTASAVSVRTAGGAGRSRTQQRPGPGPGPLISPDKGAGGRHADSTVDATPRSADSYRAAVITTTNECSGESGEEEDDDLTPRRRQLTRVQYEQLLRCAQQLVASTTGGDSVAPIASVVAAPVAAPVQPAHRSASAWAAPRLGPARQRAQ